MNDLSLLLYLADVLPAFASAVGTTSGFFAFIVGIALIFYLMAKAYGSSDAPDAEETIVIANVLRFTVWLLPTLIALCWLTYLVPTKETFYAIAVSEVGEEVLNTPEIGKARQALNNWLDKQIQNTETTTDEVKAE